MPKFSKKTIVAAATIALLALGGTAFAYFTSTGSGTGSGTTGTSAAFTVSSAPVTGNAALTPGGATDSYTVSVTNPGSGVQHLTSVTVKVANSDGNTWTAVTGCSAADYTATVTVAAGDIAPGATKTGTATLTMNDTGINQDGCKGATVPLYFSAS